MVVAERVEQQQKIYETDWDCLVILDACRYDAFRLANWLSGSLGKAHSAGSCTDEWFLRTFTSPLKDTVLVSPHPFFSPKVNPKQLPLYKIFEDIVYVTRTEPLEDDGIPMGLCPAEHTTEATLNTKAKRIMVHYAQPHFPALGDPPLKMGNNKVYPKVKTGELDLYFVQRAYMGNIRYVLKEVERLLSRFGHIAITSDHGELLGEDANVFGHPPGYGHPMLREVPWFEVRNE